MENISKIQAFASKFNETNLAFSPTSIADAKNTLLHLDFPTTKTEFWKYTRLAKLAQLRLHQEKISENEQVVAPLTDNGIVRITNGYITSFSKEIAGLTITPFSKCSEQQLSLIGKKADLKQNIFLALRRACAVGRNPPRGRTAGHASAAARRSRSRRCPSRKAHRRGSRAART